VTLGEELPGGGTHSIRDLPTRKSAVMAKVRRQDAMVAVERGALDGD
jgi:hypothetical protein